MSTSAQKPASVILFTAAQAFSILREVFLDWNALNVKYTRENARDPLIAYVKYAERNEESLSDWHWPIVSECRRILAYQERGPQAVADIAHGGWINFEAQLRQEAHRLIELELANELQNRLEDIESVAPPNPHWKRTTKQKTNNGSQGHKPGRKAVDKVALDDKEKQIWNLHKRQGRSAAIIASDLKLAQKEVHRAIDRMSRRAKRIEERKNRDASTDS